MKYFFTNDCYWDSIAMKIFRNNHPVDLPSSHIKILTTLLKSNGQFVSHEVLHYAITDNSPLYGDWKASLSNKFTRNKENEKGLLVRVPEIEPYFEKSKSQSGGGYKLTIPEEHIVDGRTPISTLDEYREIWDSNSYLERQQSQARIKGTEWFSKNVKQYLQGGSCAWPLIFGPSQYTPVKRAVVDELIHEIENEGGIIALTAAGGEGKTTILMQLCAELFYAGKTILYHAPSPKYDIPTDLYDCVFMIDNPANTVAFKTFLSRAAKEGLAVVIASRSNEWSTLKETLPDDTQRSIKEIELSKISVSEARAFAKYIKTHIPWIKRSVSELEDLFYKDSCGFLYASMLMAIYNTDSLEVIAERIIKRISEFEDGEKTLKILAAIVFAEQSGTGVGTRMYRSLCQRFDVNDRDAKFYLRKEAVLNGSVFQTRHATISKLFYKYLFNKDEYFLYEDEQEDVIIAILDIYLDEIHKSTKDYKPTDSRVLETSSLLSKAFSVIDYAQTQDHIIQRLLESCQQHGQAIIDRFYHRLSNDLIKDEVASKCFERKLPIWEVYRHWLRYLTSGVVSYDKVIEYIKILCLEMNAPIGIWNIWIDLQEKHCSGDDASIDKIREIFQLGLQFFSNNAHWWISWASFEMKQNNIGDISLERSARWILKEGCSIIDDNPHLWITWADLEVECGNLGNGDEKNTARWIVKEGCSRIRDTHLLIKCAELEETAGNVGDIAVAGSARHILSQGCAEFPQSMHVWIQWAEIETRIGNIGGYEITNSAAWIFKEACTNHGLVADSAIWEKWVDFAARYKDSIQCLDGDAFSPARILKLACVDHNVPNSQLWLKWAKIEEAQSNIGDYDTPCSAAWIFKEVCLRNVDEDEQVWIEWAYFCKRNKENAPFLKNSSFETILKNKCLDGTANASLWVAWAVAESANGNVGDYSTEYSAAWLYQEACVNQNFTKDASCLLKWARFAHKHPMRNADGDFVDAEYVLKFAQRTIEAFSNPRWIELADFKKEIGSQ